MYKNKMHVMDADCLRNGSLFCRFAGKVNIKMKNESITGFCGKCATRLIGHACLFAEQGNRVRIPDTERSQPIGFAGSKFGRRAIRAGPGGRLPKVAVFLKHCFPYGAIRAR